MPLIVTSDGVVFWLCWDTLPALDIICLRTPAGPEVVGAVNTDGASPLGLEFTWLGTGGDGCEVPVATVLEAF